MIIDLIKKICVIGMCIGIVVAAGAPVVGYVLDWLDKIRSKRK